MRRETLAVLTGTHRSPATGSGLSVNSESSGLRLCRSPVCSSVCFVMTSMIEVYSKNKLTHGVQNELIFRVSPTTFYPNPMRQLLKAAQKLSGFSRTVPFTRSRQRELFKYTSGRWLYNEEERE